MTQNWDYLKQEEKAEFKFQEGTDQLDPVFRKPADGTYGFLDETWLDAYGPFVTYAEASEACQKYASEVLR